MTEQEILALAEFIKGASEIAWSIALARVYAYVLQYALWAIIFFVLSITCGLISPRLWKRVKEGNDELLDAAYALDIIACIIFALCFAGFLTAAAARLVAPEYFAVIILAGLV